MTQIQSTGPSELSLESGQYVTQIEGYRAFIPASLCEQPSIHLTRKLQTLLSEADIALARLDESIRMLPNLDMFVYMYIRKEAVLSSQIEGTQSSLNDVLRAEAKMFSSDQPQDVDEVINYISAMKYGLKKLKELPVCVRLFRKIHGKLLKGGRGSNMMPGELRTSQNWIGPANCTLNNAKFVPPPHGVVPDALADLERFLHADIPMPLLIRIGLAHAQFETIHPFLDGNGRIGRLLITFLLCERKALEQPVLYLSYYFKNNQDEYYKRLQEVRDTGAWEAWLEFFLRGVTEVSQRATETSREILALREQHRNMIVSKLNRVAGNGHLVLDNLLTHPVVSVATVQEWIGASFPAANELISRLAGIGILQEITGRTRNRWFMYADYVNLFIDSEPDKSAE